jgi:hydrogenase-4 component E
VAGTPLDLQLLNLCAALLLLLSFAMLAQRRIVTLVNLLATQGALLFVATVLLAWRTGERHLYLSAVLTLALKVVFLPWLLHRLIRRLQVYWDTEPLLNISGTMLVGLLVVVFSFGLAQPISALANTATRNAIGIAVAVVLLSFLTMITRRKAMSQVIGFLSMENGLFFGAMSATYGMPMIVEFGVALDVLVAVLVLGIFFFQIREQFDSLDLHHLESLKERQSLEPSPLPNESEPSDPTRLGEES